MTLGEELPRDTASTGAEGRSHRHLRLPPLRAGEKQVGDVGADDEEHERHRSEEHEERGTDGSHQLFAE